MQTRSSIQYRARRVPCRTRVVLRRDDRTRATGELRDVGLMGARLAGIPDLARGDQVVVDLLGRERAARVRWARGQMAGLAFTVPLTPRELEALAGAAGRALASGGASPSQAAPASWRRPTQPPPASHLASVEASILAVLAL